MLFRSWQKTDKKILKRINSLINDMQRSPFAGMGSPEALKHSWTGYWSRRINRESKTGVPNCDIARQRLTKEKQKAA